MYEEENMTMTDEMERCKSLASLHEQLKSVTQERDSIKNSLVSKDVLIKKLEEEVEKRDNIIKYYTNTNQSIECVQFIQGQDEQRIFEIQKKEEVPYLIKIEKLSPRKQKQKNDALELVEREQPLQKMCGTGNNNNYYYYDALSSDDTEKTEELETISPASISKFLDNAKSKSSTYFSPPPNRPRSVEKRSKSRFEEYDQSYNNNSSSSSHVKRQKTSEGSSKRNYQREWEGRGSKSSSGKSRFQDDSTVFKSDVSVLTISENLRFNYGTLDWELGECEIGQKFWFDNRNAHKTKFFLKLHSDYRNWEKMSLFILKEQVGLSPPQTHHMRFHDIRRKLESTPNKRIWLYVRDFDIFSPSTRDLLGCASIEPAISHFSFGDRLYSPSDKRIKSDHLLEFIFKHLTNLEYCSINNKCLYYKNNPLDGDFVLVKYTRELPKLKTIRLIHSKLPFSLSFIGQLVEMSKNLDNFYGFPLKHLEKSVGRKILEKGALRSIYIKRDEYNTTEMRASNFLKDLSYLNAHQEKIDIFDEFDARTFFLDCARATRSSCIDQVSEILKKNSNFLSKLKVGVYSSQTATSLSSELQIPRLRNLKTLHLDMNDKNQRFEQPEGPLSFFPKNFDIKSNLPKLVKVELFMEFVNSAKQTFRHLPEVMFEKYFPQETFKPGVSFQGVECLTLHGFVVLDCMPQISRLFPNVKRLCIHENLRYISKVLPACYHHWKNLKQLVLETSSERREYLDSALTGLCKEKCEELTLDSSREEIQKSMKKHGKELSICHLADLELLRIVLRPSANMDLSKHPVVTRVGAVALYPLFDSGEKRLREFTFEIAFDERVLFREKQIMITAHSSILPLPFVVLER